METLLTGTEGLLLSITHILDGIMNFITSFLGYRPFGFHGVNSLLSISILHIIGFYVTYKMVRDIVKHGLKI
tara:strand:+ start:4873 stop:5088 length:216 start_codon:yes stop_codon:yes gene_type:complete